MRFSKRWRCGALTVAVLGGATLAGSSVGVVLAAPSAVTYRACVAKVGGALYDVTSVGSPRCDRGDRTITWNEQGPPGPAGTNGKNGTNGSTILSGSGAPPASTGAMGDFYLDIASDTLYGPKSASGWPSTGTSLVGKQGASGPAGPAGSVTSFTTSTGTTGPSIPNAGTYEVFVTYAPENPSGSAVSGACSVNESSLGASDNFLSDFELQAESSGVYSMSGMVVVNAGVGTTSLSVGCTGTGGQGITVQFATWWVAPVQVTSGTSVP
jgi:hypothetical protein